MCAAGARRSSEINGRTVRRRESGGGGGGGLKDNENDFFSSRKEKGPGLPGTAAGVVVVVRRSGGGGRATEGVLRVYTPPPCGACVAGARVQDCFVCRTQQFSTFREPEQRRGGCRNYGRRRPSIYAAGERVEGYERTRGEREPTFGRVYSCWYTYIICIYIYVHRERERER